MKLNKNSAWAAVPKSVADFCLYRFEMTSLENVVLRWMENHPNDQSERKEGFLSGLGDGAFCKRKDTPSDVKGRKVPSTLPS